MQQQQMMTSNDERWRNEQMASEFVKWIQDTARKECRRRVAAGGDLAVRTLDECLAGSDLAIDMYRRKVTGLERDLEQAQASVRAMVGQSMPEDVRVPIDPPAGHGWTTGIDGGSGGPAASGRLICVTCTGVEAGGVATRGVGTVLAAECLERFREADAQARVLRDAQVKVTNEGWTVIGRLLDRAQQHQDEGQFRRMFLGQWHAVQHDSASCKVCQFLGGQG